MPPPISPLSREPWFPGVFRRLPAQADQLTGLGQVAGSPHFVFLHYRGSFAQAVTLADGELFVHDATQPVFLATGQQSGVNLPLCSPLTDISQFPFRLTSTSGIAVPTADIVPGAIWLTPVANNGTVTNAQGSAWAFNGTVWVPFTSGEVVLQLNTAAGKNYDVFAYVSSTGVLTLVLSTAWASDTSRTDALGTQNGVLCNSVAYGACAVGMGRYVGTIRSHALNSTADTNAQRFVWNYYNRVPRPLIRIDSTASWTYGTLSLRQANNNAANKLEIVLGLSLDDVSVMLQVYVQFSASSATAAAGIGLDTTSALYGTTPGAGLANVVTASTTGTITGVFRGFPGIGYHTFYWLEEANANTTFFGLQIGQNGGLAGAVFG